MTLFMGIMKSLKMAPPYRFSFISENGPLLSNLSLNQNILHASDPTVCCQGKKLDERVATLISESQNQHVKTFYQKIDFPGLLARNASATQQKYTAICSAILSNRLVLLLDIPEAWLTDEEVELLDQLIMREKELGKIILLTSPHTERWWQSATHLITRKEDLSFSLNEIGQAENLLPFSKKESESEQDVSDQSLPLVA